MRSRKMVSVVLFVILSLLLMQCAAPVAPAQPAAAPSGRAATFTVAASADIDTADPHISQLLMFNNIIRLNVFNSLVRYAPNLDLQPDLAESWTNPDDKTYIFKLRQGAKYHNGQEVEAKDVEFSFKRIGEKQTVFSSRVANIESYEVVDKSTIKITLKQPQADFLDGLVFLSIAPESAEADLAKKPIGSGPFKFVEWVPNDHITLERNPDYWETDLVKVDQLIFKIIPEAQVAVTNLQSGEIDGILDIPVSQAVFFKDAKDVKAIIQPTSSFHLYEMLGKNSEPIRNNVKVRQALAYCMDKDTIQKTVFSGEGRQKWSFVPYGSWAYKEEAGYPYDPEKAKALLAEAGVGPSFEFSVIIPSGYPDGEKATTIWQACLANIGVKLNIQIEELSVWLDHYINHTYDVSWNVFPGFADPNYFVSLGLKPHFADAWKNADAEKAADDANTTLDQAKRKEFYAIVQDAAAADLPVIVVQEAPQASLVKPNVEGWEINPLGMVIVRGVSVK
ncbi:MAG: ABC transporter substrate-binding protein [Caldilineaceae bacterium]